MLVAPVDGEGEFRRMGLADEDGAGIEQLRHAGGVGRRHRVFRRLLRAAAAGRIARDVVDVLDREAQPGERPGPRMGNLHVGIVDEGMNRIGREQHGTILDCDGGAV